MYSANVLLLLNTLSVAWILVGALQHNINIDSAMVRFDILAVDGFSANGRVHRERLEMQVRLRYYFSKKNLPSMREEDEAVGMAR